MVDPRAGMDDEALEPRRAKAQGSGAFHPVSSQVRFPQMEERILADWRQKDTFRRSVEGRAGGLRFIMFEGPPTANGLPGIHHVLSRVFKDIFPRYKTMQGFYAPRKGGWDTHGLPVELEVEKQLGIQSKSQIEDYGVARFNELCRASVFKYVRDWESITNRSAYWLDLENAYVTYHNSYIETGWWIVKTLWDAGLVYQGRRVTPHCPRCGTTLSSHEVALGYKEDTPDPSVYVKFEADSATLPEHFRQALDGEPQAVRGEALELLPASPSSRSVGDSFRPQDERNKVYLLAWTTTPWTLPGNTGLSISAEDQYVLIRLTASGEHLVLARQLLPTAITEEYTEMAAVEGSALVGVRYHPLYNPFEFGVEVRRFAQRGSNILELVAQDQRPLTYPVLAADFVSMEDGTGIVHTAPPFGEDDYNAGSANQLLFVQPVDLTGRFTGTYSWAGKFVKNADPAVMDELKARGLLYRRETIRHTYPFCWRCDSPLLYYAKSSWYLRTSGLKERMLSANESINWYPAHIKNGRFGEWLRGNVDWAISRERYWGTPWPVWECGACRHQEAVGGREDLGQKPGIRGYSPDLDLHRPYVDAVTYQCPQCQGEMRRVPEVMDCWFDSGAMPLAQWHYPFENKEIIENGDWYPADFICEAVDQTRGWFYSLLAIAALLEEATHGRLKAPSYKNVICLGLVLDGKGEKMSKSRGNVVNPTEVFNAHGVDAVRWYLYSATPAGNSRRFSVDLVGEAVRKFLLTLWNTYSFFTTYANLDGWRPSGPVGAVTELDQWVLSRLNSLVAEVTESLEEYDTTNASRKIQAFVDDLSNWYVRRSRRRFWKSENDQDKLSAYETLYECLVTLSKLLAPFTPFIAEELYQNLVCAVEPNAPDSVHLADYPKADPARIKPDVAAATDLVIKTVSLGRAARSKSKIRVRQPLQRLVVATSDPAQRAAITRLAAHVKEELNVKEITFADNDSGLVDFQIKPRMNILGPKHGQNLRNVLQAAGRIDPRTAAPRLRAGAGVDIEGYSFGADELEVATQDKPGYAVASEGGLTVACTTEITPALAMEGKARELVRYIQNMRKTAGFEISDRIAVYYSGNEELARVFETHSVYIKQETLAERLVGGPPPQGAFSETPKIEGSEITLGVTKV